MTTVLVGAFKEPFVYVRTETGQVVNGFGIYDIDHLPLDTNAALGVAGRVTVLDVRVADLGFTPAKRDQVTVGGIEYVVNERYPSSSGMMKLHLRKA